MSLPAAPKPSAPNSSSPPAAADAPTRLLKAAGPIFAQHGFDHATIRQICKAADVNLASVGYYFGDKLGLYRAVINGIRDARDKAFPVPPQATDDPLFDLYRIIHTVLSRMLAQDDGGWETVLFMREMQKPTEAFCELVNEFFRPVFERICDSIRRLMLNASVTAEDFVVRQLALSAIGQCLYYRVGSGVIGILISETERNEQFNVDSIARHITAVILASTGRDGVVAQKEQLSTLLDIKL